MQKSRLVLIFLLQLFFSSTAISLTIFTDNGAAIVFTNDDSPTIKSPETSSMHPCATKRCSPNDLRYDDDELNEIYHKLNSKLSTKDADELQTHQREWIQQRDTECGVNYQGTDREKWLGHILSSDARTACVIRVTNTRTSNLNKRFQNLANISFDNSNNNFHGKTKQEWVREYWKWVRNFSPQNNPSADLNGEKCMQGQSGDVWFLTGSTSQARIERHCEIPSGTALIVPAVNVLVQMNPGKSVECDKFKAHSLVKSVKKLHFSIDDINLTQQALQQTFTDCFQLNDKRRGVSGEAVGGGHWAFIEPLPSGQHTLSFGGVFKHGFAQDIHYDLTVSHDCSLPLQTGDADIIGIGSYKGLQSEPMQLGKSGHEVRSSKVVVNHPEKPVVLVLSAYDPTWWKVMLTPGTVLKGVILSGYHTQAVTGISRDIPLIKAVHEEKGSCPYFLAIKAGKDLSAARNKIKKITGNPLQQLITDPVGDRFIIGSNDYNPETLQTSNDYTIEDYPVKVGLPAGQKGIDQLVLEEKLRRATKNDIQQWENAASAKYRDLNPTLTVSHFLITHLSYVVLKPLTLPTGMYGAHSRSFLIPKGIPKPEDLGSHNTYFFMETGKCTGTSCR